MPVLSWTLAGGGEFCLILRVCWKWQSPCPGSLTSCSLQLNITKFKKRKPSKTRLLLFLEFILHSFLCSLKHVDAIKETDGCDLSISVTVLSHTSRNTPLPTCHNWGGDAWAKPLLCWPEISTLVDAKRTLKHCSETGRGTSSSKSISVQSLPCQL